MGIESPTKIDRSIAISRTFFNKKVVGTGVMMILWR
jgi:hypothetical protein